MFVPEPKERKYQIRDRLASAGLCIYRQDAISHVPGLFLTDKTKTLLKTVNLPDRVAQFVRYLKNYEK